MTKQSYMDRKLAALAANCPNEETFQAQAMELINKQIRDCASAALFTIDAQHKEKHGHPLPFTEQQMAMALAIAIQAGQNVFEDFVGDEKDG